MCTPWLAAIALVSLAPPQSGGGAQGGARVQGAERWTALPFPTLCMPRPASLEAVRLDSGRHLVLPGEELARAESSVRPELAPAGLLGLLEDEALAAELAIRFHPSAPPLLARGDARALEAARAVLVDLDRAARGFEVELLAWITDGATELVSRPAPALFEKRVGAQPVWDATRVRSGEVAVFGERRELGFVSTYGVEVATDSGVADPQVGKILFGRTLHLRACRVRGGRALHLDGFLDAAELAELERFETGTADLGVVQEPRLQVVQIAFSGVVESGGRLAVAVRGSPLRTSDWTLWIEARTTPDPPASTPERSGWRALDVALLETAVRDLPLPAPGAGRIESFLWDGEPEVLGEALAGSNLAQAAELARPAGGRGETRSPLWGAGVLLAPAAQASSWAEIDSLVDAAEARRLAGAELVVRHGALQVALPVVEGMPARVLAGTERTLLVDYDVQVAQETWMPAPRVEPFFDGVLVQGHLREGAFVGTVWTASSAGRSELAREEIGIGRMQSVERGVKSARADLGAGPPRAILTAGASAPGVELELRAP